MRNIDFLPDVPVLSRYSAPWDADCWYYSEKDVNKDKRVSSNNKAVIKKIKSKYVGCDYIVTYDSFGTKQIDHQENDFYVERDASLFVCVDEKAVKDNKLPAWLKTWENTNDVIETTICKYVMFEKVFFEGEHVIIPPFEGNYHNYFIVAKANDEKTFKKIAIRRGSSDPFICDEYEKQNYENYLACTFNNNEYTKYFEVQGEMQIVDNEFFNGKKQLRLDSESCIKYTLPRKDKPTEIRLSIDYREGNFGVFGLLCTDGKLYYQKEHIADVEKNNILNLRFIVLNSISGAFKLFVNSLEIKKNFKNLNPNLFDITCFDAKMFVQNIYISDYVDDVIYLEDFKDKCSWHVLDGEKELVNFPYANNKSLRLSTKKMGTCGFIFPKVSEKVYIEQRVFIKDNGFTAISVCDDSSNIVCSCAFYKNNVFSSDGSDWVRELGKITPHTYYPVGNWYDVKFCIDLNAKAYYLFVDGARLFDSHKIAQKSAKRVCKVDYTFSEKSDLFINYVKIYSGTNSSRSILDGKVFNVKDFGALGNGKDDDTKAIQKAVDACAFTGGSVLLDNGIFRTGEIKLKSDMTFFVSETATLLGTQNHFDYPLREPSRSLCANRQLGRGLLYADKVTNLNIKGGGMLDGNGKYRFKENDPVSDRRALDARPDIIYITQSIGISITDLNFRRSAFWTVVPLSCENVRIDGLHLDCQNTPNRDGIDPVDCKYITISNCNIMAGDDGICFKSSDTFGCENIEVYNCMIQSLASAIKFGTDTYYTLKNASFHDCFVKNVNRCAISLESVDGAEVDNVTFSRLDCTDCASPIYVVTGSRNRLPRNLDVVRKSTINNIRFSQINARNPRTFGHPLPISEVMVIGESKDQMISNITFDNCDFEVLGGVNKCEEKEPNSIGNKYPEFDRHGLSQGYAFTFKNASNIKIENVKIRKQKDDARKEVAFF